MGNSIVVYAFSDTGEYVGEIIAWESPRQPGVYLIPKNATTKQPPEQQEDKIIKWDGKGRVYEARPEPPAPEPVDEAAEARKVRNALLINSDWTMLPDVPVWVNREDWQAYRQALRDVPQQDKFPNHIEWPVAPRREK